MENIQTPSPSSDPTEGGEPIPPTDPVISDGWRAVEDGEPMPPTRPVIPDGWREGVYAIEYHKDGERLQALGTMGTIVERLNQFQAAIDTYSRQVARLSEQLTGDDWRLEQFWKDAQELADRAGHCEVFDEIAEALGGPSREREYNVTVNYSYTVTVTARNEEDAEQFGHETIQECCDISNLYVESTDVEEA